MSDSLRPHGLYSPRNSPGQNTGVGSCSLLQGIFPTQRSNPDLQNGRQILYQLSHPPGKYTLLNFFISEVAQSCPALCDPWAVACQASPSMGFSRQEYWSGLPCPSPEDLPDPEIEPRSLHCRQTLPSEPPGNFIEVYISSY